MKRSTHAIFGGGVAGFSASLMGCEYSCILAAIAAGSLLNALVDSLSHIVVGDRVYRGRLLHSLEGITIFFLAASMAIAAVASMEARSAAVLAFSMAVSGASHILLDLVTPGGVYVAGRRVRVPLASYDDPVLNVLLQASGLMLAIASLV